MYARECGSSTTSAVDLFKASVDADFITLKMLDDFQEFQSSSASDKQLLQRL
jgi:hypothetical protein